MLPQCHPPPAGSAHRAPAETGSLPISSDPCPCARFPVRGWNSPRRSEEHTSELQSLRHLVCRLLLEKREVVVTLVDGPALAPVRVRGVRLSRAGAPAEEHLALRAGESQPGPPLALILVFFFNDGPPPEISPFSLPRALPI